MNVPALALSLLTITAPIAAFFALVLRLRRGVFTEEPRPGRLRLVIATVALGALVFVPAWLLEKWLQGWAGLDEHAKVADLASFVYAFLVVAPTEQGLKVAAVTPAWRSRRIATSLDGIIYAAAAGLGFISAHNLELLLTEGASPLHSVRALLAAPAHVFFAGAWGYALGRSAQATARAPTLKRFGGRAFNLVWLGAMLFNGIFDHIVFARGTLALLAAIPILLAMAFISYAAAREVSKSTPVSAPATRRQRFLRSIAPPSIGAVRAALARPERPLMLRWIGFGALVQAGVITACLVAAVVLGHRVGLDFAAVDQGDAAGTASLAPLSLLGAATLLAFPIAGYLVARASATHTVLEPAIASALAIIGTLVLLGVAAPIAVVFAMALAPVAFGLACAGAWIGLPH